MCSLSYAVFPVVEPKLLEFPESTFIEVNEGANVNVTCTVQAGVNASVWWTASGGDPIRPKMQANVSPPSVGPLVYANSNTSESRSRNYMVQYSSVLHLDSFSSQLAGVYACVVDDPGYPNNMAHEEYKIAIKLRLPTTMASDISIEGIFK